MLQVVSAGGDVSPGQVMLAPGCSDGGAPAFVPALAPLLYRTPTAHLRSSPLPHLHPQPHLATSHTAPLPGPRSPSPPPPTAVPFPAVRPPLSPPLLLRFLHHVPLCFFASSRPRRTIPCSACSLERWRRASRQVAAAVGMTSCRAPRALRSSRELPRQRLQLASRQQRSPRKVAGREGPPRHPRRQ